MKSALVMHGYRIIQRAFNSDIHFLVVRVRGGGAFSVLNACMHFGCLRRAWTLVLYICREYSSSPLSAYCSSSGMMAFREHVRLDPVQSQTLNPKFIPLRGPSSCLHLKIFPCVPHIASVETNYPDPATSSPQRYHTTPFHHCRRYINPHTPPLRSPTSAMAAIDNDSQSRGARPRPPLSFPYRPGYSARSHWSTDQGSPFLVERYNTITTPVAPRHTSQGPAGKWHSALSTSRQLPKLCVDDFPFNHSTSRHLISLFHCSSIAGSVIERRDI